MIPDVPPPPSPGFEMREDGLYFMEEVPRRASQDDAPPKVRQRLVCAPFEILAQTRNFQSTDWGLRLRWLDPTRRQHQCTIPRDQLIGDGRQVLQMLARHGLLIAGGTKAKFLLLRYLEGCRPPNIAHSTRQTGWHEGMFVLPHATLGLQDLTVFFEDTAPHAYGLSGTLQDWQSSIATHAAQNSRLVFALAAAFAAALVGPLEQEPVGFHLFGDSTRGKSCTAKVAGSVWGGPVYHVTWSATLAGLETIAFSHSDTLLVLDEEAQKLPEEADSAAFLLVSGQSKIRSTRTLEQEPPRRWRSLFLSTGETALYTGARVLKRSTRAGHSVRLVDIPIVPEGQNQAFESPSTFSTTEALANHLLEKLQQHYGMAALAFLEQASRLLPKDWAHLRQELHAWAEGRSPQDADPQVRRVIQRFALVAMGGRLAEAWGIVPWPKDTTDWGVGRCLDDWLSHRGGQESGEVLRAVQAVCDYLAVYGTSRFQLLSRDAERLLHSSGYRRFDTEGRTDYLFHPAGWREAIGELEPRTAAEACARAGLLRPTQEAGKTRHQRKVRIPDQGLQWLYEIPGRNLEAVLTGRTVPEDEGLPEEEVG